MLPTKAISTGLLAETCRLALGKHVGRGRDLSVDDLARLSGIDPRTVASHCLGAGSPQLFAFLRYASILGADFVNEFLAIAGLTGAHPVDGTEATPGEILSDTAAVVAELAQHLADGHLDHREEAAVMPKIARLGLKLFAWSVARKNKTLAKQARERVAG